MLVFGDYLVEVNVTRLRCSVRDLHVSLGGESFWRGIGIFGENSDDRNTVCFSNIPITVQAGLDAPEIAGCACSTAPDLKRRPGQ